MKFYDLWKQHKAFIFFVLGMIIFFILFFIDNRMEMLHTKKEYEEQIEELKGLVQVSNIGETPEKEFDIYQAAEEFLQYYYGVSQEVSAEYRAEKLMAVMTEDAYARYEKTGYDNTLDYTVTLTDIHIYVDYANSSRERVYTCIFYDENTDWSGINTIVLKKYWKGIFRFDNGLEKWLVSDITDSQELLTREEFNALNIDTDESVLKDAMTEGVDKNADTEKKE